MGSLLYYVLFEWILVDLLTMSFNIWSCEELFTIQFQFFFSAFLDSSFRKINVSGDFFFP
jgi:hypothetical protein